MIVYWCIGFEGWLFNFYISGVVLPEYRLSHFQETLFTWQREIMLSLSINVLLIKEVWGGESQSVACNMWVFSLWFLFPYTCVWISFGIISPGLVHTVLFVKWQHTVESHRFGHPLKFHVCMVYKFVCFMVIMVNLHFYQNCLPGKADFKKYTL